MLRSSRPTPGKKTWPSKEKPCLAAINTAGAVALHLLVVWPLGQTQTPKRPLIITGTDSQIHLQEGEHYNMLQCCRAEGDAVMRLATVPLGSRLMLFSSAVMLIACYSSNSATHLSCCSVLKPPSLPHSLHHSHSDISQGHHKNSS